MQAMQATDGSRSVPLVPPGPPSELPRSALWPRLLLVAGLGVAIAAFYVFGFNRYLDWDYLRNHLDLLQRQIGEHLLLALLLYFIAYTAATAFSLPAAWVLTVIGGALFGRWLGTGIVSLASTAGATLAFLTSRYLLRDFVQRWFGDRLHLLNEGVEKDGAYYLLTLRLVPVVPFFLINLGMGLTPIRLRTYVLVSWLGMLPGTFLYVNAGQELGRIDSPGDVLSPAVLVSLALLGVVPLAIRKLIQWRVRLRTVGVALALLLVAAVAAAGVRTVTRYRTADEMAVPVRVYSNAEYSEDPANRSVHFGQYNSRTLKLIRHPDGVHFDFVLEPADAQTARVVWRDVDVRLMTPGLPEWTKADAGLRRIALTDRQWNRQQVSFDRSSTHLEVGGGDGFEAKRLVSAELAKNCLNAGLWEVLLFVEEGGEKKLYYQSWFTFPLGHYKDVFERNTGLPYWRHWYYLEHWFDPAGTPVALGQLRTVKGEREVPAWFGRNEPVIASGEQARKRRTTIAENVRTWGDYYDGRKVRFATFIPPGRYSVNHPWKNEFWRLQQFDRAILRDIESPASSKALHELELVFASKNGGTSRFFVSGFDLETLPALPMKDYPKGLYMPMGIGTPPFFQSYADLEKAPPDKGAFFSVLLDADGRWINHHDVAIDGPVLHRDADDPHLLHVYLLSYERHALIAHFMVDTRTDAKD
jgi:uncharacterized membrane protein YdjX (TVP38/TMEM64 family)